MKIIKTNCSFEREPLIAPFGFKGGYLTELWQTTAYMQSESGNEAVGLGTQSTLWSDANVFVSNSEHDGNNMMFQLTSYALEKAKQIEWHTPFDLLDKILPEVYEYGKKITNNPHLRLTFVLNSLVAVDNAAWILYCKDNSTSNFDDMLPEDIKPALYCKHAKLANIPLMSYDVSLENIVEAVKQGYFFLKIKIGCDPDKDDNLDKMLEWDKNRLKQIHEAVKGIETQYTDNGHIPYYLDANGRYDSKDRLMQFLDFAKKTGALDRIILMEEPFAEEFEEDVSDIPVRLAADESAHSDRDALAKIDQGFSAIALKPIAKTMSMSLRIVEIAHEKNIPCFCADLTVNPILVDWNKNVATRLPVLPGMKIGVLESNGHQNYKNWQQMKNQHPCAGALWIEPKNGIFNLDQEFYKQSGGIFKDIIGD
ncbi:MAG: L-alanine-DL-glutamate epimerase [Planctomycetes bacterium GWF2_41_51]|nr:MAG: L-alanine-DL-glutamate epimerase [Planctomycetes bacterium GWF2_41_51]HBG28961.1 L-alanine-DL-glutamate epimerase [Phycisphaerales bacterium]